MSRDEVRIKKEKDFSVSRAKKRLLWIKKAITFVGKLVKKAASSIAGLVK